MWNGARLLGICVMKMCVQERWCFVICEIVEIFDADEFFKAFAEYFLYFRYVILPVWFDLAVGAARSLKRRDCHSENHLVNKM